MRAIAKFLRKPLHVQILLIRASILSVYYKKVIGKTDFQKLAAKMGEFRYETPVEQMEDSYIGELKWVMNAISKWTFWGSKCFDRALTAKNLLNRKGYPCTIYMGVRKDMNGQLVAHAWLRCGNRFVTGGKGAGYAITGIYGDRFELSH